MANETTTTTITEIVPAERISDLIMSHAIDNMVAVDFAREVNLPIGSGKVYNFPIVDKDTAAAVNEASSLSNNDFSLSETSVTIGQVGILRTVQKLAARTNQLGPAGLLDELIANAGELLAEKVDDDLVALLPSITASVGTSGSDLTVANMVGAIGSQRAGKAKGDLAFILHTQQALDLTTAVAASTASIFNAGHQSVMNGRTDGRLGAFLGVECVYTSLCDTANTGADRVGACVVNGRTSPRHASLGLVVGWGPEMSSVPIPAQLATTYGFDTAYGVGLVGDAYSTKIVTDA